MSETERKYRGSGKEHPDPERPTTPMAASMAESRERNALGDATCSVGADTAEPYAADEGVMVIYGSRIHTCLFNLQVYQDVEQEFALRSQHRALIGRSGYVETHYGHFFHPDLMRMQSFLVSTGLWEMIPNNLGQPDDYWARRVR